MDKVRIFNTMSRQVEEFEPVKTDGTLGLYHCGPTVYSDPHIGNLRTSMFVDVLKKMFRLAGYNVKHVSNITDVGHLTGDSDHGDDKMEKQAAKEGLSAWDIAKKYEAMHWQFCEYLNIERPTVVCHATEYIQQQINFVKTLEEKGFTYRTSDGIYFDTSKDDAYGYLARLDKEGLRAGDRVDMGEKKNPTDFSLWKFSPEHEQRQMEWDSPWGKGFPGWHIECSAMSIEHLGTEFDIHAGGADLMSVHHSNEVAQNCAYTGHRVVKYWMHGAFLNMGGEKMSKSKGHVQTIKTELVDKGINPLAYRYLCLTAHYRSQLNYTQEAIDASATALARLNAKVIEVAKLANGEVANSVSDMAQGYIDRIKTALFDDLNTAVALTVVRDTLNDDQLTPADKMAIVTLADSVFSLDLGKEEQIEISPEVQGLLDQRAEARANKDWAASDALRDQIADLGFVVKDGKDGQTLEKK